MIKRIIDADDLKRETCFLWGPRQCERPKRRVIESPRVGRSRAPWETACWSTRWSPRGCPLGDAEFAIEAKSSATPTSDHLEGLRAWKEEHASSRCMLVCRIPRARTTDDGIEMLPVATFLRRLWPGEFQPR